MKTRAIIHWSRIGSLLLFVIALIGLKVDSVSAQEASRTLDNTYQFDERGDAEIANHFQLSRALWEQWKAQYGDHPDMLLRIVNHDMAAAVIEDFTLEKDDIHRRAVSRFKARALAEYDGNQQFKIQVPKSMKWVAGSGSDWVFSETSTEMTPDGGHGIVNVTDRMKLPAKARDAHFVTGSDYDHLIYSLKVSRSKPKLLLYVGLLLLVAAVALGALSSLPSRVKAASPT